MPLISSAPIAWTGGRLPSAVAWLWGAALLLPYPAIPVGSNSGLQLGHFMIVALTPVALLAFQSIARAWIATAALVGPQFIGLLATGLRQVDFNATIFYVVALMAIPVTAHLFQKQPRALLLGVCSALALHGVIGLYQEFSFSRNEFPLRFLFVNPSFAEYTDEWTAIYAEFVKRPFGLTPEPSALLSFASPWVLLLGWAALDPSRWKGDPYFRLTIPRAIGLLAVVVTFALSMSGGLAFFAAGAGALAIVYVLRNGNRGPIRTTLILAILVAALWDALSVFLERLESESGQLGSWNERAISLLLGLRFIGDANFLELWFGYGAGAVSTMAHLAQVTGAVHSMVLTYVVAYGLIGAIGLVVFVAATLKAVSNTADPVVWLILIGVWASGPLLITNYNQLLALWGFIALPLVASPLHSASRR